MPYKFNVFTGNLDYYQSTGGAGSGNVTGIPPTTDKAITRWVGTGGDTIQDSPGTLVQDGGAVESQGFISNREINSTINVPTNYTWVTDSLEMQPGSVIVMNPGSKIIIL